LFVDDNKIKELNKEYLNKDYPTDVISFPMREGEFTTINKNLLGDVVVSLDDAGKYAKKRGTKLEDEIIFLVIHGILHLCGYDHIKEKSEALKMKNKEKELYDMSKG
jgi:probable rRNA maturation factor